MEETIPVIFASVEEWCLAHNCDHGHCPLGCDHPQPILFDNELYCGWCYLRGGQRVTKLVPCTPDICI